MSQKVRRLYEQFKPEHYELELRPDRDAGLFKGQVTISGHKAGRPSRRLTLHQKGLKITGASLTRHDKNGDREVNIDRINHHRSFDEVRLHSPDMLYPGSYTVHLEFEGVISRQMSGIYPCFFTHDGQEKQLIATQFESHHAREAFPCIDEPEAKATFQLSLLVPKGEVALSNTPISSSKDLPANGDNAAEKAPGVKPSTLITFEPTPRMSTYLLAFVYGELHNRSAKTKSGVEVSVWGTVTQPAAAFDFALSAAVRSIEFFEDYFNVPYPLKKADHVALPDFSSGAMENWGLITYREAVLLLYPDAVSQSTKEIIATVIAHETSHQWFGNLVTMQWWDDLWLNESFANLMEYVAVDALFPDWHIWESFVVVEGLSALRRDATPGVQAVRTAVNHPDEISTLFDPSIVYAKGGRLLYMLKNHIGEGAFRAGLSAYFKKHAYQNTRGADLWAALGQASQTDVAGFMNPWLEQSGFPLVTVRQTGRKLTLHQQHFLDNPALIDDNRLWSVPLFLSPASAGKSSPVLDGPGRELELDGDQPVLVNHQAAGHYITHYTESSHRDYLRDRVADLSLPTIDRLMLLNNSAMLARAGVSSLGQTLELLPAYENEAAEPVWDMISLIIADVRRFIDLDNSLEEPLKNLLRQMIDKQYRRLGWEERPAEDARDQKLRATILGLGAYAEAPAVIKRALELFEAYKNDSGRSLAAELRGVVFGAAVKQNHPGAVDYLLDLYASTNSSDLQRDITGALMSTRSEAEAERLLGLVKDPTVVKPQDADRWIFYLLGNRFVRPLAWRWMKANWAWVEATYGNDKSYDYFPRYAAAGVNTPELQKLYLDFFRPKQDIPALKRNIAIGIEEIASRLAWLERDLAGVQQFFLGSARS